MASLHTPRSYFQAFSSPTFDQIYVTGGLTGTNTFNDVAIEIPKGFKATVTVEKYDVALNQWTSVAPMK